jgi:hypothetical protein
MWGNEHSHSQVSSHFGSLTFDGLPNFERKIAGGQNPLNYRIPYITQKLLEHRCLKWDRTIHLYISNTSYGQKNDQESNWQFDSQPLKVENSTNFLAWRCHVTYCWKTLNEGYNFALDLTSIGGLHTKSLTSKVVGILVLGISGLPNDIWVLVMWLGTKYIIRGKVVASPKSRPWWILWIRVCPWFVLAPKVFQLCTNQLVIWFCAGPHEWLIIFHSS